MTDDEAKRILRYKAEQGRRQNPFGTDWQEWRAIEHVLKKWERSDTKLKAVRVQLGLILDDAEAIKRNV